MKHPQKHFLKLKGDEIWFSFKACFFIGIQGISVKEISKFPDIVEFRESPLNLSIQKSIQKLEGAEIPKFSKDI